MSTPMNTTQSIVQSPVCLCVCLCARLLACPFACLHALLLACMHETELTDCTVKALIDSLHHADHFWCYQQSGPLCDCPPSPPIAAGDVVVSSASAYRRRPFSNSVWLSVGQSTETPATHNLQIAPSSCSSGWLHLTSVSSST